LPLWRRTPAFVSFRRPSFIAAAVGLTALGLTSFRPSVQCDAGPSSPNVYGNSGPASSGPPSSDTPLPKSELSICNLGFGSVLGICAGVFVKKGLKTVAFLVGGVFVLLQVKTHLSTEWTSTCSLIHLDRQTQYFSSRNIVSRVNWDTISSRYESVVDRLAGPPSADKTGFLGTRLGRLWTRFTDFLIADFPPRATFLAGFALGMWWQWPVLFSL
jgi:FUN14 domain-containing protein 1